MTDILVEGTHRLIAEFVKRLAAGESFDNPVLADLASEAYAGTRAQGAYTPRDAYDAFETAVNMYLLDTKAAELLRAPTEALPFLESLVSRLPRQSDRTAEQTEFQQFSTPPTMALLAASLIDYTANSVVLEPSAGTGSLAIWPRSTGARVVCNETHSRRRALLTSVLGFETYDVDAEMIDELLPGDILPTAILMNPPFSATAGRVVQHNFKYGLRHIESALRRLKDGGRLVAIGSESLSFERAACSEWWKAIAAQFRVQANVGVNGKDYGKYGTTCGVQILVIDKTGPCPGDAWPEQLQNIVSGRTETLEETWAILQRVPRLATATEEKSEQPERGAVFLPYVASKCRVPRHPLHIVPTHPLHFRWFLTILEASVR